MEKRYSLEQYERDLTIVKYVEDNEINLDNSYDDIDAKIDFLKSIGIMNLRVGSNEIQSPFVPVEDCEDARISQVVNNYYDTSKKRINEYENGERVFKEKAGKLEKISKQVKRPNFQQEDLFLGTFNAYIHSDDGSLIEG